MPITDLLERNAHEFCHETALVEINPEVKEIRRVILLNPDWIHLLL